MYACDLQKIVEAGGKKIAYMRQSPWGYLVLSGLAGIYVGFGIVLIFAVGGPIQQSGAPYAKLVMGASFGIALSLVVFAGSELFTGNNMVFAVGGLRRTVGPGPILQLFVLCYVGNLLGSLFLAWLVIQGGSLAPSARELIVQTTSLKMNAGAKELFIRGILCNWLVCLAVWCSGRTQSDTAKLILIFWCLFAFIASGFEHSVANMTLLGMGLFLPHGDSVSWAGFMRNLFWVTGGNVLGGGMMVGMAYWFAGRDPERAAVPVPAGEIPVLIAVRRNS